MTFLPLTEALLTAPELLDAPHTANANPTNKRPAPTPSRRQAPPVMPSIEALIVLPSRISLPPRLTLLARPTTAVANHAIVLALRRLCSNRVVGPLSAHNALARAARRKRDPSVTRRTLGARSTPRSPDKRSGRPHGSTRFTRRASACSDRAQPVIRSRERHGPTPAGAGVLHLDGEARDLEPGRPRDLIEVDQLLDLAVLLLETREVGLPDPGRVSGSAELLCHVGELAIEAVGIDPNHPDSL